MPEEQIVTHSHSNVTYTDYSSYEFRKSNREGHVGDHSFIKAGCLENFKSIKIDLEKNQ